MQIIKKVLHVANELIRGPFVGLECDAHCKTWETMRQPTLYGFITFHLYFYREAILKQTLYIFLGCLFLVTCFFSYISFGWVLLFVQIKVFTHLTTTKTQRRHILYVLSMYWMACICSVSSVLSWKYIK